MTKPQLTDVELRAWYAFLQTYHRVFPTLDEELSGAHDLPLASYEVLLWLAQSPGRSMKMADLARTVLLSPSGLTRLVDRLVKAGLVERMPSGADARVMLAHLTPKGLEKLRQAAPTHVRGIKEHFTSKLDQRDLETLSGVLEKIIGAAHCPQSPTSSSSRAASPNGRRRPRVTALR